MQAICNGGQKRGRVENVGAMKLEKELLLYFFPGGWVRIGLFLGVDLNRISLTGMALILIFLSTAFSYIPLRHISQYICVLCLRW